MKKVPSLFTLTTLTLCLSLTFLTGCRTARSRNNTLPPETTDSISGGLIADDTFLEGDTPLQGDIDFQSLPRATDVGEFTPVYFQYDSSALPATEIAKIQNVANLMKQTARLVLVVEGNCDERGTTEYNISLGERRALAVREHLIALGVDANSIQTVSYGEERPADFGHDESAWIKNRRAEFAFYRQ